MPSCSRSQRSKPDFLARSFDLDEFRKDVELFESLYSVLFAVAQLHELLDDTCLAVGSEAYTAALQAYNYAKASGNVSGLDELIDEMGKRFSRKPSKPDDEMSSEARSQPRKARSRPPLEAEAKARSQVLARVGE